MDDQPGRDWRRFYKDVQIGLCHLDADLRFIDINDWMAALNDRSAELCIGHTFAEMFPTIAPDVEALIRQVVASGKPRLGKVVAMRNAGETGGFRKFKHSYYPVQSDDGETVGVSGVIEDVAAWNEREAVLDSIGIGTDTSERKQVEEALQASVQRYRDLAEGSVQGILVYTDFAPLYANDALSRMFGYDDIDDILALKSVTELLHIDERRNAENRAARRLDGEGLSPWVTDLRGVRKDGSTVWIDASARSIKWNGQDAIQATYVDVTTRKQNEETLKERERQLQQANRTLEERVEERTMELKAEIEERKLIEQSLRDSEQRLRDFADSASDWFWELDAELRFTHISGRFEEVTGLSASGLKGRTRHEAYEATKQDLSNEDAAKFEANLRDLEAHRPYRDFEVTGLRADGTTVTFLNTGKPVFGEDGSFRGYRGTGRDITEGRRAQDALAASEQRFRAVFDHAPIAISLKNLEGRIELVNQTYSAFFNIPPDRVVGGTSTDLYPPGIGGHYEAIDEQVAASKNIVEEEREATNPGASVKFVRITKFPVFDQFGEVSGIGTFATDISAEKIAEESLRQAQKMEAVGQLTGGIAHEFNNLLQVVAGNIALLEDGNSTDADTGLQIGAIKRNVTRGAELTSRLLSFARRQPLAPKAVEAAMVLAEMRGMLVQTLGETIEVKVEPTGDVWRAEADLGQLENALLNLAINGRDAMPNGGVITLSATNIRLDETESMKYEEVAPGDYVVLSVADNGSGMSEEEVGHAFEPFFTTKDVGKGTGLGLSMVYGFAQQSGGFAEIESEPGVGTTVRLFLPRLNRVEDDATAVEDRPPETVSPGSGTILLVEDDTDVRESLASQLTGLGYQVIEAEDGAAALTALANDRQVDLLFTDVVMPGGLSGLELAQRVLQDRPELKILYTTGYSEDVVAEAGQMQDGAVVLHKPYNRAELAVAISRILN